MTHLTLTKAKTSRISRPLSNIGRKGPSFDLKARRVITSPAKERNAQKKARPQSTQKLEVTQGHIRAGRLFLFATDATDSELLVSDVLAGMNYLASIQLAPFPQKGLSRHAVADLYHARQVIAFIVSILMEVYSSYDYAVSTSLRVFDTYVDRTRTLEFKYLWIHPETRSPRLLLRRKRR